MREIYLEGNNGGDYIRLKQYKRQEKKATVFLEVGHCCVLLYRHEVPVELLTSMFYQAFQKHGTEMKDIVSDALNGHSEDYIQERASKVKDADWRLRA